MKDITNLGIYKHMLFVFYKKINNIAIIVI